jgi:hypothetical protein
VHDGSHALAPSLTQKWPSPRTSVILTWRARPSALKLISPFAANEDASFGSEHFSKPTMDLILFGGHWVSPTRAFPICIKTADKIRKQTNRQRISSTDH